MNVKPTNLAVNSNSVIITIPNVTLKNGMHINLCFDIHDHEILETYRQITGIETVTIKVGNTEHILEDNKANVFYADLLHLGYMYRLRYGNNGCVDNKGKGDLSHFLNLNTPCCAKAYDPANKKPEAPISTPPAS